MNLRDATLEGQLQTQLYGAWSPCAQDGALPGNINRLAWAAELAGRALAAEYRRGGVDSWCVERRMVKDIETLGAELSREALSDFRVLRHREVPDAVRRRFEDTTRVIRQRPVCRGNQGRTITVIATEGL